MIPFPISNLFSDEGFENYWGESCEEGSGFWVTGSWWNS
jgi:hypothetical protein